MTIDLATVPPEYEPRCARRGCNKPREEHHPETQACREIPPAWSGDGPCYGAHDHEFKEPWIKPYWPNVPRLGHVAVSRHAQDRAEESGITEKQFEDTLLNGEEIPDGMNEVFRERNGIRVVILLKPTPDRGARLVKTIFKPKASTVARRAGRR